MPKRPATLETAHLALELLRRIPRGRKVTAADLHRQLKDAGIERDIRTIQRQLEMLSTKFDIERDDRARPYGYRWLEQSSGLAVRSLTPQESLLLGLAEKHLRGLLPSHLMRSMEGFFEQARRNLASDADASLEREWEHKVRVVATSQPLLPPTVKAGVFEAVSEALYANLWLNVDYRNAAGKRTSAAVMPLGLAQQGPRLYLVCRFQDYDNERSLALHRIQAAEVSPHGFKRPRAFDLKRYDDEGRFGFSRGRQVRLSFEIDRQAGLHLLESPLSLDQQASDMADGRLRITATVADNDMLHWWLRGFGDAVSSVRCTPLITHSQASAPERD